MLLGDITTAIKYFVLLSVIAYLGVTGLVYMHPGKLYPGDCFRQKGLEVWQKPKICQVKMVGNTHYLILCPLCEVLGQVPLEESSVEIEPTDMANEKVACDPLIFN